MWLFLNNAMVSIVEHREHPELLVVRGRIRGDVDRFLGRKCEAVTPAADYRFRAVVDRAEVQRALDRALDRITYPNFKASCVNPRHDEYVAVWSVMHRWQEKEAAHETRQAAMKKAPAKKAARRASDAPIADALFGKKGA